MRQDLCVSADRIIDGTGEVLDGVTGVSITPAGNIDKLVCVPEQGPYNYPGCSLMPGLINVHDHLFTGRSSSQVGKSLDAARRVILTLASGVTTTRDMGSPEGNVPDLRRAVDRGVIPGPQIMTCIKAITTPGGPGAGLSIEVEGPEAAAQAAREISSRGADFLKVFASSDGTNHSPLLSIEEISAVAAVAHQSGLKLVAHATTADSIERCIEAGVDGIEHGPELTESLASEMVKRGILFAPTMSGFEVLVRRGPEWNRPTSVLDHFAEHVKTHPRAVQVALAAGVEMATGGDSLGSVAQEARMMHAAGVSLPDVIQAATLNAANYLGLDDVGRLEVGYRSDLLVVEGNPLTDVASLGMPVAVIRGSRVYQVDSLLKVFPGDFLMAMQE